MPIWVQKNLRFLSFIPVKSNLGFRDYQKWKLNRWYSINFSDDGKPSWKVNNLSVFVISQILMCFCPPGWEFTASNFIRFSVTYLSKILLSWKQQRNTLLLKTRNTWNTQMGKLFFSTFFSRIFVWLIDKNETLKM